MEAYGSSKHLLAPSYSVSWGWSLPKAQWLLRWLARDRIGAIWTTDRTREPAGGALRSTTPPGRLAARNLDMAMETRPRSRITDRIAPISSSPLIFGRILRWQILRPIGI